MAHIDEHTSTIPLTSARGADPRSRCSGEGAHTRADPEHSAKRDVIARDQAICAVGRVACTTAVGLSSDADLDPTCARAVVGPFS